jgi:hypothetical protein
MAVKHDTWVNRIYNVRTAKHYYLSACLCGWESDHQDNPDKAHEQGVAHMAETADPFPEHLPWINLGVEWLDTDGSKRIVYTPLCACGWTGDRQTDVEEARLLKLAHEENPVAPEAEGE